jgi:hypothetical protein
MDTFGLFGTLGANLANQSFTAFYQYDLSLGTTATGPFKQNVRGAFANSPSLGAVVTINGKNLDVPGNEFGEAYTEGGPSRSVTFYIAEGVTSAYRIDLYTYLETNAPGNAPVFDTLFPRGPRLFGGLSQNIETERF